MITSLFNHLKIRALLKFNPALFFNHINHLDWYQHTLQSWVEKQAFIEKDKIMEVGCATGVLTQFISDIDCYPTGVDLSEQAIEIAKRENPDIPYYIADVNQLPFEDNVFDAVISASVINIVDDKKNALKEMIRVCKKGGTINILVPLSGFNNENLKVLQDSLKITNYSSQVLKTWHNLAPKLTIEEINDLFLTMGLKTKPPEIYLNGMVFSISAIKSPF